MSGRAILCGIWRSGRGNLLRLGGIVWEVRSRCQFNFQGSGGLMLEGPGQGHSAGSGLEGGERAFKTLGIGKIAKSEILGKELIMTG